MRRTWSVMMLALWSSACAVGVQLPREQQPVRRSRHLSHSPPQATAVAAQLSSRAER